MRRWMGLIGFFYCSVIDFKENICGGTLNCPRKELVTCYGSHSMFWGRKANIFLLPLVATSSHHSSARLPCAAPAPVGLQSQSRYPGLMALTHLFGSAGI